MALKIILNRLIWPIDFNRYSAQSAGAVEYADCFSAEGGGVIPPSPNVCPGYNIKQFDGEAPVMLEPLGMKSIP